MKKPLPLFIVGVLLTLAVALNIYWWIIDSVSQLSFEMSRQQWLDRFPPVLRSARLITALNMFCLVLAIFVFAACRKYPRFKLISLALILADSLLLLWQLFSLM